MLLLPFRRSSPWLWPKFRLDFDIYLLTVYAKGLKDDLTVADREALCKAVEAIEND